MSLPDPLTDVQPPILSAHISPAVYAEILERRRQAEKWGEQNHPDGTGPTDDAIRARADAQFRTDAAAAAGTVTWSDILTEEYREALAESDPRRLHTELVQLAAVATQWADAIQRRGDLA